VTRQRKSRLPGAAPPRAWRAKVAAGIGGGLLVLNLTGCGGGVGSIAPPASGGSGSQPSVTASDAGRLLEQSTFGPTPALVAHVQKVGISGFLDEQFAAPPASYPDPPDYHVQGPVEQQFFVNALTAPDQLRERAAFALSEMFVVSSFKINDANALLPYVRMLQKDAFGNYFDLLKDVTLSPTMGRYLDMVNNDKPDAARGTSPNENYAREIMQLFSIGLQQLNPDGTPKLDANGVPIPTYDQDTIEGFSSTFTGWTFPTKPGATLARHNPAYYNGPMEVYASNHDPGTKQLLNGLVLPAGQSPDKDLDDALHNIVNHPNVGPFIGRQLIQHLVTSNPSSAYVGRVSAVFADNGAGVRGDLQAIIRAILTDPEARRDTPDSPDPNFGHLREPALYITSLLRALNAVSDGVAPRAYSARLGQEIMHSPSVFNFFPPNYAIPGSTLKGPEFGLQDTANMAIKANFINALAFGSLGSGTMADLSPLVSAAGDANALLDSLTVLLLHGEMPATMRATLLPALTAIPDSQPKLRAQAAFYLVATSSLYQVQH